MTGCKAGMLVGVLALMSPVAAVAGPVSIGYEVVALGTPGRYEYHYTLGNVSLGVPLSWFSVDFDTGLYEESTLLITTAGLGEWSQQMLGSVLGNPAQYDAYKTVGAGLAIGDSLGGFSVAFTWLGAGTPGSQAFTIYDPGTLNVLDSGSTTAVGDPPPPNDVPEPSSAALVLLAACGAAVAQRRARHGHGPTANGSANAAPGAA